MPTMNPTIKFSGLASLTAIKKIWDMYLEGTMRGVILADVMSPGKTYQMFGFWLVEAALPLSGLNPAPALLKFAFKHC